MAAALSRSYVVQSISQAADNRMHVSLFENNAKNDANGAPMGSNNVTFTMSTSEAKGFFPGDLITISLTPESPVAPTA